MKITPRSLVWTMAAFALIFFAVSASRAETAYFLMSGPPGPDSNGNLIASGSLFSKANESYVIAVSDAALIKTARDHLAAGRGALYLVPHVKIAAGGDGWNRNYDEPGHPQWDWRATELIEWITFDPALPQAAVILPELHSRPTRVSAELLSTLHQGEPTRVCL